ncbi:MAG: 6-carboxytetrahydropterin synthase [Streptomycetaceae bacterium]|nr:6-carboxytetrahydropterin synthase [Streptomycetaceae bacterium]
MSFRIGKRFSFDAAHHLVGLRAGHKCARPHGHTYTVEVVLAGEELVGPGFVTDFGDLKPLGEYIDGHLDHRDLNEVLDFPPTSERLAQHLAEWFVENVEPNIDGRLVAIRVSETPATWAEFAVGERPAS